MNQKVCMSPFWCSPQGKHFHTERGERQTIWFFCEDNKVSSTGTETNRVKEGSLSKIIKTSNHNVSSDLDKIANHPQGENSDKEICKTKMLVWQVGIMTSWLSTVHPQFIVLPQFWILNPFFDILLPQISYVQSQSSFF